MSVASKEARETQYWLRLIQESKIVNINVSELLNENDELTFGFDYPGEFPLKTKTSDTYKSLLEMKQSLRKRGILCFDDAYFLAIEQIRVDREILFSLSIN